MDAASSPRASRRRIPLLALITAVLLGQMLLGIASPASACACGGFVDPADGRGGADVVRETAVLSLRDGVETIVMGLALDAERVGATLLMPTPAVPEVSGAHSGTLREMAAATAPREVIEHDLWGENPFRAGAGGEAGGMPPGEDTGAPTVHAQERIGNYEVAVLGGEAEGVRTWLADHGFALPEELSALIDPYAEEGWTFTAVRYAADAVLSGDVEPLRFDFASEELVYPMRLSQAARAPQTVHLHVIGETAVRRTDGSAERQEATRPWIGSPEDHGWTWSDATLRELTGVGLPPDPETDELPVRHRVVTEFVLHEAPPESFVTDLSFAPDPAAQDVIPTVTTTEVVAVAGVPVGWLLVLAGLVTVAALLLAAGASVLALRSRRGAAPGAPPAAGA